MIQIARFISEIKPQSIREGLKMANIMEKEYWRIVKIEPNIKDSLVKVLKMEKVF